MSFPKDLILRYRFTNKEDHDVYDIMQECGSFENYPEYRCIGQIEIDKSILESGFDNRLSANALSPETSITHKNK